MLNGRVALVTGGMSGIGKAISLKLAEEGADIAIFDIREEPNTKREIFQKGVKVEYWEVDVSDLQKVENSVKEVKEKMGRIDILVNNAGITRDGLLVRLKEEDWDRVIEINLKGAFNCSRACVRYMMKQKEGCIVNIASVIGIIGNAGQVNYAASKGGLIALTKSLAKELAPWGIRVNAVAPGYIKTPMTENLPEEVKKEFLSRILLKREGLPEEVANVVFFLASPLSSYLTGEVIKVDGGMVLT
ncbi:MAG TPA: 3-oxoacyl-[acyl-carrier-protein] reductase [bacterium]|nr:3-oxoacyl-[acyl-carrier-protein] reductase [bacterium]HEX67740.1 3-oxoacyl-[acyl-carrier-protein] reductase [bacterium]